MNEGQSKIFVPPRTLDHWFREYSPRLLRKLSKYGLNTHECEDILSETWLTILRSGYDGGGVFSQYLTKIAVNRTLDALRVRKRRKLVSLDDVAMLHCNAGGPSTIEVRSAMRIMCQKLSFTQQMAYITIQYAGISFSEASRQLHTPVQTLRARIRRCTALLREPARYSTYPAVIALPIGYAPAGIAYIKRRQEPDVEYSVFEADDDQAQLEVVCVH